MVKHSVLHKIRAEDDRYEVSSTLRLLFPAEDVSALADRYKQLLEGGADESSAGAGEAEDAGGWYRVNAGEQLPQGALVNIQHRLERIQVYEWGTFRGYHDIAISRAGT